MKLTTTALGLVLALTAAPAAAQYNTPAPATQQTAPQPSQEPSQPGLQPSRGALKAIADLQTAVNANDFASVPAKAAAAQQVAKTKEDKYIIAQLQLKAALAAKDNAATAAAIDAIAASGYVDSGKAAGLYQSLGATFYNAKQFDQAAAMLDRALALDSHSIEGMTMLAETRNAQGRRADAVALLQRALQAHSSAGRKPPEEIYKRAVGLAYEVRLPVALDLARQWAAAYPSQDSWKNAMAIYRNTANLSGQTAFDLLRLARLTNALTGTGDYHLYAYEAAEQANYGEAKSLLDEGIASGKIKASDPIIGEVLGALKGKAAPTPAELATAEKAATAATAYLRVGDRYYAAGNFQKAAELYRQSLVKGADADLANLRLGEALARAGDKAGATTAFNAVKGQRAEIAKFWLMYLQSHG